MKLTKKELADIARQASSTSGSLSDSFSKGLKDAAPAFNGIENAGKAAFKAVAAAATVAATAVAAVVAGSVMVGASFEAQMSSVKAISGATGTEMESLNDLAKELGATTKFTATEVGQAMEYMAMAGWKTQDMLDGMQGVLSLAAASGEDLAITSDIVTDAMTAFGLGADQVDHFADVLAATATNSNTTVSMMGESFKYSASLAGAMGYRIEDVSVAIGLMANSGIKASQAGTALRKIFAETTNGAKVTSRALGEYTIQTTNADGSMRELKDNLEDLRKAFSTMTESEKAANAEAIAGKTGMSGLLAIVNASQADYEKLTGAVNDCSGAAQRMADIRIDNLSGDATIMMSALEGLGIQIYEDINEPLRAGVQWFTSLIGKASTKLTESGFIGELAQKIPTAVRKTKELTEAVSNFTKPFFAVGKWLIDNPGLIVGTIASIGTAIAVYKIASGIMSIASAFGALGPVGWAILGIAGVVGVIAAIGTAVSKSAAEAKKANLAEHFGKITLSLDELEQAAKHIVATDSLVQIQDAMSAFQDLGNIQRDLNDSARAINKLNWKVSVGMELSTGDQEQYKNEISKYVIKCQEYVADKQYAVSLAVGVLTDGDLEGNNIVHQVNQFYTDKQQELEELGTQLNAVITEAFQDGLLDMDEVAEITQLQEQMARIQSAVAGSNFEAGLDLMKLKFEGGELDAETFQNLQVQIQEQMDAAIGDYDEAYTLSVANAKIMLDDNAIDKDTYLSMIDEFRKNYLEQVGEIELKATNFQLDTILSQYDQELSTAIPQMKETFQNYMAETFENDYNWDRPVLIWDTMIQELRNTSSLDKTTKAAIAELLENMEPSTQQMEELAQKYRDAGQAVPEAIQQGMMNYSLLGALTKDEQSIWNVIGDTIANNEDYTSTMEALKEKGSYIPEAVAQAISDNKGVVETATTQLQGSTSIFLENAFRKGFDVKTDVRLKMNPIYNNPGTVNGPFSNSYLDQYRSGLAGHAEGGIFTKPHIAWFAENGPESAIPLDGSQNAIDLWEKTGELLGIGGAAKSEEGSLSHLSDNISSNPINADSGKISYSPTLQFYGEAPNKKDLDEALELSQEKFEEMMGIYMRNQGRLSFS